MSFDPDLVDALDAALTGHGVSVVRKRMFGGIALIVAGHMAMASRDDVVHVRVGKARFAELVDRDGVGPMQAGGRPMTGWVTLEGGLDLDADTLAGWAGIALDEIRSLPPK